MQYRSLTRQTPPALEPVTLTEAKAHLRVDTDADDTYIATLITAAREWVEQYLDRTLIHTQWVMCLDKFPPDSLQDIELPRPPMVASGTATAVTLTYTAENGTTAAYSSSSFRVDRASTPGAVKTLYGQTWQPHLHDDNSITVTWWAGYGASGSSVPAAIRHAMLMLIGTWYERRASADNLGGAEVPFGVRSLLDSQKWGRYS